MVQKGTLLNIIDNSGAKHAECIGIFGGYRKRYAAIGDLVMVAVKGIRVKRRDNVKAKKGGVYMAVVVRTKVPTVSYSSDSFKFNENAAVLITKQKKMLGTRVFGPLPAFLRQTKFLKLLSTASGSIA
jgi:large subunit ribosomal protein L14